MLWIRHYIHSTNEWWVSNNLWSGIWNSLWLSCNVSCQSIFDMKETAGKFPHVSFWKTNLCQLRTIRTPLRLSSPHFEFREEWMLVSIKRVIYKDIKNFECNSKVLLQRYILKDLPLQEEYFFLFTFYCALYGLSLGLSGRFTYWIYYEFLSSALKRYDIVSERKKFAEEIVLVNVWWEKRILFQEKFGKVWVMSFYV